MHIKEKKQIPYFGEVSYHIQLTVVSFLFLIL